MIREVSISLELHQGEGPVGTLSIRCLHGRDEWHGLASIVDLRSSSLDTAPSAPVQLLEEMSYEYSLDIGDRIIEALEPADLFSWGSDATSGRLEVRRATGTLLVVVTFAGGSSARCEVEVRSRKLNYQSEYRSMLSRIARESAELVQSAFAASSLPAFQPEVISDPETLYQRFAFVQSLLESSLVQDAFHEIEKRPHFEHVSVPQSIDPARRARCGRLLASELTRSGQRQRTIRPIAGRTSVPRRITEITNISTYDTVPNRFVKYVLTRWRDIAFEVEQVLRGGTAPDRRGSREARGVVNQIERVLSSPAMIESGPLDAFPHANQVLQGRSGYRDLLEAFLLAEAAASIDWQAREQLFRAGQRNVAELYEYWVFLELVHIVESLPGFSSVRKQLVRRTRSGLSLNLRRSGDSVVELRGVRRGTEVVVRVWFNKEFRPGSGLAESTWTVAMRPDCSIEIAPAKRKLGADTWIHFDAKYRLSELTIDLTDQIGVQEPEANITGGGPLSEDLAKMHTYRDAIRRTAAAYVLYPGQDELEPITHRQYHEILPGLGGFVLRPTESGESSSVSASALRAFLEQVIDHVSAQGTAAERSRYWTTQSYLSQDSSRLDHQPLLSKPPADTNILIGFVKSRAHLEWVLGSHVYNLRADVDRLGAVGVDSPELNPDFIVLYSNSDENATLLKTRNVVSVRSASELEEAGYPMASGRRYFCLEVETPIEIAPPSGTLIRNWVRNTRDRETWGAPILLPWIEVASFLGVGAIDLTQQEQ